jgi:Flp pilus assembly protein TadG
MVIARPNPARRLARLAARLRDDRSGVSAVEFALILPVMLLLYAGSVEFSEALSVDRKVNQLASTVGDLVAQRETINATEMDNILSAGVAIMLPYDSTTVRVQVIAVNIVSNTSQTVAWAEARNDTDPPDGSAPPIAVPTAIATVGGQVIVTRVRYSFESPFSGFMATITGTEGYDFEHVFMMRPRLSDTIAWI